jgi:hypothetical protein
MKRRLVISGNDELRYFNGEGPRAAGFRFGCCAWGRDWMDIKLTPGRRR